MKHSIKIEYDGDGKVKLECKEESLKECIDLLKNFSEELELGKKMMVKK